MRSKIILVVSLIVLALGVTACGSGALAQVEQPEARTIQVTGRSQIFTTPDIARITIGVRTEGDEAAEALTRNNSAAQQVIDMIVEMGVEERDIQTTNFSIYLRYDYDERGRPQSSTYVVENMVSVTVRELDMLGDLLDQVVASGANAIHGIQFEVDDKTAALAEARIEAVEDARVQAEQLAQAAGVALGVVRSITTQTSYPSPVYLEQMRMDVAAEAGVPISQGQVSVSMEVTVIYEIR
ncbi:MAG: SIMPL domain-containing protein [Anaerolineales bacterium]